MELKRCYFTTFGFGEETKYVKRNLFRGVEVTFRTHISFGTINESLLLKWN